MTSYIPYDQSLTRAIESRQTSHVFEFLYIVLIQYNGIARLHGVYRSKELAQREATLLEKTLDGHGFCNFSIEVIRTNVID